MPLARQHREALAPQRLGQPVARGGEIDAASREPVVAVLQPPGDRRLQVGRGGEGEELVGLGDHRGQRRRGADEADLPAGQGEHLAGRADLHAALAHAREGDQRPVARPVEHHVLPDLVADRDGVVAHAELGQQRQVRRRGATVADGIERVVQHHQPRALAERRLQRRAVSAEVGRRRAAPASARRRRGGPSAGSCRRTAGTPPPRRRARSAPRKQAASASVAPEVTVTSLFQSRSRPWRRRSARATASRSAGRPGIGGYWL